MGFYFHSEPFLSSNYFITVQLTYRIYTYILYRTFFYSMIFITFQRQMFTSLTSGTLTYLFLDPRLSVLKYQYNTYKYLFIFYFTRC